VIVEQTSAVDPETRLGEFAGRLSADEMRQVDSALIDVLGLR
jgi:mRNA interferase MazF